MLSTAQCALRHPPKRQPERRYVSRFKHCSQISGRAYRLNMNPRLQQIIETANSRRKHDFPWKQGQPFSQPFYTWHDGQWKATSPDAEQSRSTSRDSSFSIMAWNIDYMRSYTNERMEKALSFLEQYLSQLSRPSMIMLNEMLVSDLELIQGQSWVRKGYHLTDLSEEFWASGHYGE